MSETYSAFRYAALQQNKEEVEFPTAIKTNKMAESGGFRSFSNAASTVFSPNAATPAKPVPMKLFSTWEVEKSTPSCIPRYFVAY